MLTAQIVSPIKFHLSLLIITFGKIFVTFVIYLPFNFRMNLCAIYLLFQYEIFCNEVFETESKLFFELTVSNVEFSISYDMNVNYLKFS